MRCNMDSIDKNALPADRRARIAALEKAFAILELFGPNAPELRIADIATRTGMNRSSAQRLAHTLVTSGWLSRETASGVLSLSHRAGYPAHVYLASNHLIDLIMPLVVELNARTGLSCDLWLADGSDAITLARVPSPAASLALAPIGSRVALRDAAPGRAILARLSPTASPYDEDDPAYDAELAQRLARERDVGYAHDSIRAGETGHVIAVAFRDAAGKPIGAISVSGLRDETAVSDVAARLLEAASRAGDLRVTPMVRSANIEPNTRYVWPLVADESDPLAVTAVAKGLHLLQFFHPDRPLLTLTELSRQTGFPVPTVQRITETLCSLGYLRKDERKRCYYISVRSLDLLYRFQMGSGLIQSIWPRLIRLREECGLRCSFCVLDGTEIVHLLHVQSRPQPAFRTAYPGRRLPAVSSSGGRAMLSWLPEEEMDAILLASTMEPGTPQTVTDKRVVRTEIIAGRQRGVAFTDRQSIRDEVNVAAAIPGIGGRPAGAIVVSAPVPRWTVERLEREVVPLLLSHARGG